MLDPIGDLMRIAKTEADTVQEVEKCLEEAFPDKEIPWDLIICVYKEVKKEFWNNRDSLCKLADALDSHACALMESPLCEVIGQVKK